MISALYVATNGPYFIDGIIPWDISRDARSFRGPEKVIAHPPCERWGRYWGGGPMLHGTSKQKQLGDDGGCFYHALWAVRTFGGVLEHPEASHAFRFFGLPRPNQKGGWTDPDQFGGRSCCVAQGHYGHRAQKLTWLYGVEIDFRELIWGKCLGKTRLEPGCHSKKHRDTMLSKYPKQRISAEDRINTPKEFRDLLISMVNYDRV